MYLLPKHRFEHTLSVAETAVKFAQGYLDEAQTYKVEQHRKCTDVFCTGIGCLFAFAIFVISLVVINKGMIKHILENYLKTNFPTDSDYNPCAYGKN